MWSILYMPRATRRAVVYCDAVTACRACRLSNTERTQDTGGRPLLSLFGLSSCCDQGASKKKEKKKTRAKKNQAKSDRPTFYFIFLGAPFRRYVRRLWTCHRRWAPAAGCGCGVFLFASWASGSLKRDFGGWGGSQFCDPRY
jgi:hypothetical protein